MTRPPSSTLVAFGTAVKAKKQADGTLKADGYLVRFTSADDPDISLTRDYFTKSTYYGEAATVPVYFHHGMTIQGTDPVSKAVKNLGPGKTRIGVGTLKSDDTGIFIDSIVSEAGEYQEVIAQLADAGMLGWSSGAVSHMVVRKAIEEGGQIKAHEITQWLIGEASLTHTPAEPRNVAGVMKAWTPDEMAGSVKTLSAIAPKGATPEESMKTSALAQYGCYEWYYGHEDQEIYDDWDPGQEMVSRCYYTLRYRLDNAIENITGDENLTPDQQAAATASCFDEARDYTVSLLKAITQVLPIQDGDDDDPESAKALLTRAQKSFVKYVPESQQPPASKAAKEAPGVSLADQGKQALAGLEAYTKRLGAVAAMRSAKSGSPISAEATKTLETAMATIEAALKGRTAPPPSPDDNPNPNPAPGADGDDSAKSFTLDDAAKARLSNLLGVF